LKNTALSVSDKSVALLKTDNTPINTALVVKLENSMYCSVAMPAIACDNV
jgi:hypothetical protein